MTKRQDDRGQDDRGQDDREQDDREDGNTLEHDAALDRMLKVLPTPEPSAALRRAVAEIPLRHPQTSTPLAWPWWAWGGAHAWHGALVAGVLVFAAGALSGFYGGSVVPEIAQLDADVDDASEEPWQELSVLAFAAELDEELEP